jgi:hypothetical protein
MKCRHRPAIIVTVVILCRMSELNTRYTSLGLTTIESLLVHTTGRSLFLLILTLKPPFGVPSNLSYFITEEGFFFSSNDFRALSLLESWAGLDSKWKANIGNSFISRVIQTDHCAIVPSMLVAAVQLGPFILRDFWDDAPRFLMSSDGSEQGLNGQ